MLFINFLKFLLEDFSFFSLVIKILKQKFEIILLSFILNKLHTIKISRLKLNPRSKICNKKKYRELDRNVKKKTLTKKTDLLR